VDVHTWLVNILQKALELSPFTLSNSQGRKLEDELVLDYRKCSAESFRAVPLISNCLDRELEDKVVF